MYLYLINSVHNISAAPMCVHACMLRQSVHITCVTLACVHVSNSISTHYLSYTCLCTCIYLAQCMLSVQHVSNSLHITCVCTCQQSVCVYMCIHAYLTLNQYTYCTCVHVYYYNSIRIQCLCCTCQCVHVYTLTVIHMHIDLSLNQYTCTHAHLPLNHCNNYRVSHNYMLLLTTRSIPD